MLVQNARTLEDLVREMLRPLLKSWLDDNLPGMVERIVKAEIERVSRGAASFSAFSRRVNQNASAGSSTAPKPRTAAARR